MRSIAEAGVWGYGPNGTASVQLTRLHCTRVRCADAHERRNFFFYMLR